MITKCKKVLNETLKPNTVELICLISACVLRQECNWFIKLNRKQSPAGKALEAATATSHRITSNLTLQLASSSSNTSQQQHIARRTVQIDQRERCSPSFCLYLILFISLFLGHAHGVPSPYAKLT